MTVFEPLVIWPAPGLPALLEDGKNHFETIVAHRDLDPEKVRAWAQQLTLTDPGERTGVPLELVDSRVIEQPVREPRVRGFAELPEAHALEFAACTLRTPSIPLPTPPVTSRTFDLTRTGRILRPHCVTALRTRGSRLSIAFASDVHFSSSWQPILDAVRRYAPDLDARVLEPPRMWERFVEDANGLWRRGSLDLVVLGGDLVDHVLRRSERTYEAEGDSNVHRFLDALRALRPPTFVIPGNHDYRLYPWRPRVYGLHAIGLDARETRRILRSAGMWGGGPPGIRDLRSLQTRDAQGCTALARHLRWLAPATDFVVDCAGMRLVFVSTGADALTRWRSIEPARLMSFLRSLANAWQFPDAEGLYDLATALRGAAGGALFLHAPPLHRRDGQGVEETLDDTSSRRTGGPVRDVNVERRWHAAGWRSGVFFRNARRLLECLTAARCPLAVFSGHVHRTSCIEIDRPSRRFRSTPLAAPADAARSVLLVTGRALAQRAHGATEPPGYLLAEFQGGALASLHQRELA